ncbi:uncharacterized protein EAF01_007422 [Botrytis porri]|uniref:uncharacterized protein n=1 Tax=Botrytis porri TaxID=87229 RepID=UPI0019023ADD|nr:uncharacterized protein EAF01_007422 [Botrytis porri]KAF7902124.1 hypothetical protein EAF01_007422 [Botrytis porri]
MAPRSPLQTLLNPRITSTDFSATFNLTFTTFFDGRLSSFSSAEKHLKDMLVNYKLEQQGFPQYSRFPLEIQRKIWIHTLPDPRVIPITYDDTTQVCQSTSSIPIALHVYSISRTEALRFYSLSFGTTNENGRIYFRFRFDIPILLTNLFDRTRPPRVPAERFESFINSTQNLEKLDAIAMIPGLVKSIFGPHPRPCPDLCNKFVEKMPNLTHLLSTNCTRETDELHIGMSGYLAGYRTIGTKMCSDLSLSMKSYALNEDAQRRTDNFKRFWNIYWCQAYLELHGLPLVLVQERDLEVGAVRRFSRAGGEWGSTPWIRSVLGYPRPSGA